MRTALWSAAVRLLGPACSRAARGKLQILCYHGFALDDEHAFRPKLFMSAQCFERRMAWLASRGFAVLPLAEALDRLAAGRLREREIAITIDDGFAGVHAIAAPILAAHRFPATVYVTSYYVVHPHPVFRLVLQYMAWKSLRAELDATGLLDSIDPRLPLKGRGAFAALVGLYEKAEAVLDEPDRMRLAASFGERAGVDFVALHRKRLFHLMTPSELADLARMGVDVQLHTHRHRLPVQVDAIQREIADNRAVLAPLASRPLEHFCYPSGAWLPEHWAGLEAAGITSATTCMPGFNRRGEPALALRRFLDGDDLPEAEFAAETLAVKELARRLRHGGGLPSAHRAAD